MSDPRTTPANGRVAAAHLAGQVDAARFVAGAPAQVTVCCAGLHRAPKDALDRQVIFGDIVSVYERRDGWAFVQAEKDGYCGYVPETALGEPVEPTHALCHRLSHVYPEAGLKAPPVLALTFGARLCVVGGDASWARVVWDGGRGLVHRTHLRPLDRPMADPAATAALFLGTPYLWAGNTGAGIDCSGLVQACCLAADIPCPGDSDQQAQVLGTPLPDGAALQRNDLLFWKGHLAIVEDPETMIHATAHGMTTRRDAIAAAIARIDAQGEGPVTARRRLFP